MKQESEEKGQNQSILWREIKGFAVALIVAFSIRTILFHPFNIPSPSMYPTLMMGDFLVVSKYTYGYGKYSLPFPLYYGLPEGRIFSSSPVRGDVVVFRNLKDLEKDSFVTNLTGLPWEKDYVKRLVGLPGERIQVKNGVLHINGEPVKLRRIEDYHMVDKGTLKVLPQYIETLPNGVEHRILKERPFGEGRLDDTQEFVVPAGHYFMMGDNRDNSADSRVLEQVGFVPETHLIGRAEILFFSTDARWYQVDQWIPGLRFNRLFTVIR